MFPKTESESEIGVQSGKGCGRRGPDMPIRILPAVPPRPDLCRAVRRTVSVSMRARSIEPVICRSLIASWYGTAILSQTLFLILVNRYRTILKPFVQWKFDGRKRRSYANDAMHGYRNPSPSFLYLSVFVCCLLPVCVGWSRILRISLAKVAMGSSNSHQ